MPTAALFHCPLWRRHHRLRRFFCASHCQTRAGRLWRSRSPSSTRQRRRARAGLLDGAAVLPPSVIARQVAGRSSLPATACRGQRALRSVQAQPLQQAAASRHGRAGGPGLGCRLLRRLLRSGAAAGCIAAAAPGLDARLRPHAGGRPGGPPAGAWWVCATAGSASGCPPDLRRPPKTTHLRAIVCGAQLRAILSRLAAAQPPDASGALVAVAQSTRDHFFVAPSVRRDNTQNLAHMLTDHLGCIALLLENAASVLCQDEPAAFPERHPHTANAVIALLQSEQVTVVFPMHFEDGDESTLAASLLQEFVEARRTPALSSAPFCSYAPLPPLELKGAPEQALLANAGYVSLVIFPRHVIGPKVDKTTWALINFHAYISYHIKCSKTFVHARMRRRGDSLIQALNKAKPDLEKEKKTAQGRSFKRQGHPIPKAGRIGGEVGKHGHRSSLAQGCPAIQHAHEDRDDPLGSNLTLQGLSLVDLNAQQGMREGADANTMYLQRSNFGLEKERKHRNDTTALEELGCGLILSGRVGQYPCCGQPFLRPLVARSLEEADEGPYFILLKVGRKAVDQVKGLPPHCGVSVLPEEAEERLQGVFLEERPRHLQDMELATDNSTDENSALLGYDILPAAVEDRIDLARSYLDGVLHDLARDGADEARQRLRAPVTVRHARSHLRKAQVPAVKRAGERGHPAPMSALGRLRASTCCSSKTSKHSDE
eukprot:SM000095S25022  [mRNA]  locus=s95:457303:468122:- [translate_table: standard]